MRCGKSVTVIIPAYNYGHFIDQTLECVLAQTCQQWECVIVDDGSTDNTPDVVAHYLNKDTRFKYVYQKNQGLPAVRNTGVRCSKGEYIQFLDADDLIENRKIERQVEYLEAHPEVDIVYGGGRFFFTAEQDGKSSLVLGESLDWMPVIQGDGESALMALIHKPFVVHAALMRRSVIESIGYFNEDLRACEDWQFWVRCAAQGKRFRFENIEGTQALYRTHQASMCADRRLMRAGTRRLRQEIKNIVRDREALQLNQRLAAEFEGYEGVEDINQGRLASGIWQCLKAGAMFSSLREKLKWWFCAIVAPITPKQQFEQVVISPIGESLKSILRHHLRSAS